MYFFYKKLFIDFGSNDKKSNSQTFVRPNSFRENNKKGQFKL